MIQKHREANQPWNGTNILNQYFQKPAVRQHIPKLLQHLTFLKVSCTTVQLYIIFITWLTSLHHLSCATSAVSFLSMYSAQLLPHILNALNTAIYIIDPSFYQHFFRYHNIIFHHCFWDFII